MTVGTSISRVEWQENKLRELRWGRSQPSKNANQDSGYSVYTPQKLGVCARINHFKAPQKQAQSKEQRISSSCRLQRRGGTQIRLHHSSVSMRFFPFHEDRAKLSLIIPALYFRGCWLPVSILYYFPTNFPTMSPQLDHKRTGKKICASRLIFPDSQV